MKKFFLAALMCVLATGAFAQVNFKSVEGKLSLRNDIGLGVGTTIGLTQDVDIAPSFNMFFVDGASCCFTIDADFHYNIDMGNEFHLYPLAGPALYHVSLKGDMGSTTKIGINLGCGLDYDLDYHWTVFGEAKYQFLFEANGYDDTFLSLGVKYRF